MIVRLPNDQRARYLILSCEALEDSRLSFKARGLLAHLLSRPDTWKARPEAIAAQSTEGISAIRSGLKELERLGYIHLTRERDAGGHIVDTYWDVYEVPELNPHRNAENLQDGKHRHSSFSQDGVSRTTEDLKDGGGQAENPQNDAIHQNAGFTEDGVFRSTENLKDGEHHPAGFPYYGKTVLRKNRPTENRILSNTDSKSKTDLESKTDTQLTRARTHERIPVEEPSAEDTEPPSARQAEPVELLQQLAQVVGDGDAASLLQQHGEDQVRRNLALYRQKRQGGSADGPGFLVKAIRNDWAGAAASGTPGGNGTSGNGADDRAPAPRRFYIDEVVITPSGNRGRIIRQNEAATRFTVECLEGELQGAEHTFPADQLKRA